MFRKLKYIFRSCDQNVRKYNNIKISNKSLGNLTELKYFLMIITYHNHHSVQILCPVLYYLKSKRVRYTKL